MTLLLTASDVVELLDYDTCIAAVEDAFRQNPPAAGMLGTHVESGGFHVKAAVLGNRYVAKVNANFPGNPASRGLPTIQGVLALFDATDGRILALMDSMEITTIRTAAASAVAAKYLARKDSSTMTIIGFGNQGRSHLEAVKRVCDIETVFTFDVGEDFHDAVRQSDIVITCTPSREPLLYKGDISPGTFVAAVGADSDTKQEIAPELLASTKVVVDVLEQCELIGDLHHAIAANAMRREDVYADLRQIVCGEREGRSTPDEIIVFDSTGTALEDLAAAAVVYERAIARKMGIEVSLGA